jgi:uncharacterized protein YjiS (DUF1127 family)
MSDHSPAKTTPRMPKGGFFVRVLNKIAAFDLRHRQKAHVEELPDAALRDVGLSRKEANTAFYKRHENRVADRRPAFIGTRMWL